MSANPKWHSIKEVIFSDAKYANGQAHLEPPEVPLWVAETEGPGATGMARDMGDMLVAAVGDVTGNDRNKLNELLTALCARGDDIEVRKVNELTDLLRRVMTDCAILEAQHMVDDRLGVL